MENYYDFIILLCALAGFAFVYAVSLYIRANRLSKQSCFFFSEEEISHLRRFNNLFEDVPLHNGHEWQTLQVDDLIRVCLKAGEIVGKTKERPMKDFLIETAERCEDLSSWMIRNQNTKFYEGSNMSYLINKPKIVACGLRTRAGKI